MDLFTNLQENSKQIPLAEILRPKTLQEFLGQTNIIRENSAIINIIKAKRLLSLILWGPPGCGKTTLARLIALNTESEFIELSAVTSGIKDIKEAVDKARDNLKYGKKTILFIDEIHRYSKTQQDALLPHLENGTLYMMGSTTENPSFQVIPALISRVQVLMLSELNDENVKNIVAKGFSYLVDKYGEVEIEPEVEEFIVKTSRGDARTALNLVENSYFASDFEKEGKILKVSTVQELAQKRNTKYSRQEHFDCASAFQKSLRGSDPDAAIYYLAKMIAAGEDPRFIARRLLVCSSEDVGNADPMAFLIASNALKACESLGMPEARIALAQAVEYVAKAPKSNRAILAIDRALRDIEKGEDYLPPMNLRDAHYKDAAKYGFGVGYVYSHDEPEVFQQFLPDEIKDRKYF